MPNDKLCGNNTKPLPWGTNSALCYMDESLNVRNLETYEENADDLEKMEVLEADVSKIADEPTENDVKTMMTSLMAQSKNIEKIFEHRPVFENIGEASSNQMMTKVLGDISAHHVDSFSSLAIEFCNMIIPKTKELEKSEPLYQPPVLNPIKENQTVKKLDKKLLGKIEKTDFDDIVVNTLL